MRTSMHKRCCLRFFSLLTNAVKILGSKKAAVSFFVSAEPWRFCRCNCRVTPNLRAAKLLVALHVTNFTSKRWSDCTRVAVTGCRVERNKHTKQQNRELQLFFFFCQRLYSEFICMSLFFVADTGGVRTRTMNMPQQYADECIQEASVIFFRNGGESQPVFIMPAINQSVNKYS